MNKLFIYGDEISCKAGKYNDKLKSIITRTEITLEKKGHDVFIIKNTLILIFNILYFYNLIQISNIHAYYIKKI